ncbi:MAG TPA: hypothetical protein VM659_07905 [Dongiaceae bacterium]|nr:hypothetical protein [Dongiaceae bacterium]
MTADSGPGKGPNGAKFMEPILALAIDLPRQDSRRRCNPKRLRGEPSAVVFGYGQIKAAAINPAIKRLAKLLRQR